MLSAVGICAPPLCWCDKKTTQPLYAGISKVHSIYVTENLGTKNCLFAFFCLFFHAVKGVVLSKARGKGVRSKLSVAANVQCGLCRLQHFCIRLRLLKTKVKFACCFPTTWKLKGVSHKLQSDKPWSIQPWLLPGGKEESPKLRYGIWIGKAHNRNISCFYYINMMYGAVRLLLDHPTNNTGAYLCVQEAGKKIVLTTVFKLVALKQIILQERNMRIWEMITSINTFCPL